MPRTLLACHVPGVSGTIVVKEGEPGRQRTIHVRAESNTPGRRFPKRITSRRVVTPQGPGCQPSAISDRISAVRACVVITARYPHALADAKIEAIKRLENVSNPDTKRSPEGSGQKDGEGSKLK
jgi:hypothetical protein